MVARFGHEIEKEFGPMVLANEKGGINNDAFNKIVFKMKTIFPDSEDTPGKRVALKVDSGPGRMEPNLLADLRLI